MRPNPMVEAVLGGLKVTLTYDQYRTCQWFKYHIRPQTLHRAGNRCRNCETWEEVEVYHYNLKRLGRERPEDVVALCYRCRASFKGKKIPPFSTEDRSQPTRVLESIWKVMQRLEREGEAS